MYKVILDRVDLTTALRFADSGYTKLEHHEDGKVTVHTYSNNDEEMYPFGYKIKDDDTTLGINNAWIKPDGSIYYVFYYGHEPFAMGIMGTTIRNLENSNWVHWSFGTIANCEIEHRLTRAQRDALYYITENDHWL